MTEMPALTPVMAEFGLASELHLLEGGSVCVFRSGDLVFKRIHETSLENQH